MVRIRDSRSIGGRIRSRRKALGFSQEKLGELVGVSYQQVQKYEKGTSKLSPERLQQVAAALGVPMGYLFGDVRGGISGGIQEETGPYGGAAKALPPEEQKLLRQFRRLGSPTEKSLALTLLKALARHPARSFGSKK